MKKILNYVLVISIVFSTIFTTMSYKVFAEDEEISNIAGDGKAYAESTTATAGDVTFINDGNYTSRWQAAAKNAYAGVNFDNEYIVEKVRITFKDYGVSNDKTFNFDLMYYNTEKSGFTKIGSGSNYNENNDDQIIGHKYYSEIVLNEPIKTNDIRVNILNNNTDEFASIYEIEIFGKKNEEVKDSRLISVGKSVSASNSDNGTKPDYITDGSTTGSFWDGGSTSKEKPQSFVIDLEKGYFVDEFKAYPYVDGIRYYEYYIETSLDGNVWNKVADRTADLGLAYAGETFTLETPVEARFVRVVMTYNSKVIVEPTNSSVHMREFEVYGKENPDYTPPEADLKDPDNIAFRKQVHSHLNTNSVKNIVDGFDSTTCTGEFAPAYFDIDLEQNYVLDEIILNFPIAKNRYYYFSIYGSVDGSNYDRLYQERTKDLPEDGEYFIDLSNLENRIYRIVRVYMEYVSDGTSSLLSEVRVHGSATEENTDALRMGNIDNILDIKSYEETEYAKPITKDETIENVYGIIDRNIGSDYRNWFRFEIADNPKEEYKNYDYYTVSYDKENNKILIIGNDGISLASGLNYYLKNYCKVNISEQANQVKMPSEIVKVNEVVYKYTPYEVRYGFNYCTLNYTFSYADAKDFQKEYDWLALNGVNVVLDLAGQEAVWIKFLMNFGYDFDSAKDWLAGPTYYAWQFMDNMEVIGGPVSDEWVKGRLEMARENQRWKNSLGMQTVLQGYAGMVPNNFNDYQPDVEILEQGTWCNVPRPDMIRTDGVTYDNYARLFYEAQKWAFGETSNYYAVDPFHEGGKRPQDLSDDVIAKEVLNSLLEYDKEAVWMVQAWWSNPTNELLKGMGDAREDHVMILDLNGLNDVYASYWDKTEYMGTKLDSTEFNETSWVWCMLENYGGNPSMDGRPQEIINRINHAYTNAKHMKGIGFISEATYDNPMIYELLLDMAWTTEKIDLDSWLDDYVVRRYGTDSHNARDAWNILLNSVYRRSGNTTQVIATSSPSLNKYNLPYSSRELDRALELLFADYDRLSQSEAYRYDLTEIMRQVVNNYAVVKLGELKDAYNSKNLESYRQLKNQFLNSIITLNSVCGTQQNLLIGDWAGKAQKWAENTNADDFAKDSMIINAKTLISVWAPSTSLLTYAYRNYEGMIIDVYYKLWDNFLSRNEDVLANNTTNIAAINYKKLCMDWIYEDWDTQNYIKEADNSVENVRNVTQKVIDECSTIIEEPENNGNIAMYKKIWASEEINSGGSNGGYARYANDGDSNSYWDGGNWQTNNPWIIVDLGTEYDINKINVLPYVGNRYYLYDIYVSSDNENWTLIEHKVDTSIGTADGDTYLYETPIKARYVKINGKYNSANEAFHIKELRVYGERTVVIDKSELQEVIVAAEALNEADYTSVSWAEFKTAMDNAKDVLEKADASQEEVDNAITALQEAKEALVKAEETAVSKAALQIAVEMAGNVTEEQLDKVVPAVVTEFNAALEEARTILANDNATQEEVDASFARLSVAMHMLEFLKGDKAELQDLVDSTADLVEGNYTEESWSALQEALTNANTVLNNENAMQEEVDGAYDNLQAAINGLEEAEVVDKSLLEAMVNKVLGLEEDKYIASSWQAMLPDLEAAQEVLGNEKATQAEVDEACDALTRAYLNLRLKPNKDLLADLINKANGLNAASYTANTWAVVENEVIKAQAVLEDPEASEAEVKAAHAALTKALEGLEPVKPGDTTTSIKTGDNSLTGIFAGLSVLSVAGLSLLRKKED